MLGFGILAAGGVLLWAALTGKAEAVLAALKADLTHFDPTLPSTSLTSASGASNTSGGTKQITVDLPGGGNVTVNANNAAAAIENVKVETGMTGTVKA